MFGSSSVTIHLLRGCAAACLIWMGVSVQSQWMMVLCFLGALASLGGCPMCWLMGLFETLKRRGAKA